MKTDITKRVCLAPISRKMSIINHKQIYKACMEIYRFYKKQKKKNHASFVRDLFRKSDELPAKTIWKNIFYINELLKDEIKSRH